jgi:hypothetical protein
MTEKNKIDKSVFYNFDKLFSYSSAIMYYVLGERGVGKSYGSIVHAVKSFMKDGSQFVYLRRYKTELDTAVPKFFDALIENEEFGDDVELKVVKNKNMSKFLVNGEVAGYAIALSTANILKSTSFAKVNLIIFDEFIIDNSGAHHYLRNECEAMLDIIETIGRLRDIKVLFLGNSISQSNPYFNYFDLTLPYDSDFKTFKDGLIVVNYIKNEKYRALKKASKFGRLIEGSSYAKYAIDNEFLRDNNNFIEKRNEDAVNWNVVILYGRKYGVWIGKKTHKIYIESNYNPLNKMVYSTDEYSHDENTLVLTAKRDWFKIVVENFKIGNVRFENQRCKDDCMKILRKVYI